MKSAEEQLEEFIAEFTPEVAERARGILTAMRKRFPGAVMMVYNNYNALAIGFGTGERVRDAIFSIVLYPRWVSLFLLRGARLHDPKRLLKGSGSVVRHVVLEDAAALSNPDLRALMAQALDLADAPLPKKGGRLIIKSISRKQRSRRPAEKPPK